MTTVASDSEEEVFEQTTSPLTHSASGDGFCSTEDFGRRSNSYRHLSDGNVNFKKRVKKQDRAHSTHSMDTFRRDSGVSTGSSTGSEGRTEITRSSGRRRLASDSNMRESMFIAEQEIRGKEVTAKKKDSFKFPTEERQHIYDEKRDRESPPPPPVMRQSTGELYKKPEGETIFENTHI